MNESLSREVEISLTARPVGRNGTMAVSIKAGEEILAADKFDVLRPNSREKFIKRLCQTHAGVDRQTVEDELLKLAAEAVSSQAPEEESIDPAGEIDIGRVVRPELFHTAEVSGLAIPTWVESRGEVRGRWSLLLRWADGRRERREIGTKLETSSSPLWLHPIPGDPVPGAAQSLAGWSKSARRRWLNGAHNPDPAEVFKKMCQRIAWLLDLSTESATGQIATMAIWTILTYAFTVWPAIPYLHVTGPLGSGKSRVLDILARVVFRPLSTSNLTGPAMFRTLHDHGGVLLYDEAERLRHTNDPGVAELLSMMLAGYRRGACATRLEPVGDRYRTVSYQVFGPKALASISTLPPALASRCISVAMLRSATDSPKPHRRIDADPDQWQPLRDDLHALALNHGTNWIGMVARHSVCPEMSGRDAELWQPILALASWIEEYGARGLLALMQKHALASIAHGREDQLPEDDQALLQALVECLRSGSQPTPGEILKAAREVETESLPRFKPKGVSVRLKAYGLITKKSRGRRAYPASCIGTLREVQKRYGFDLGFDDGVNAEAGEGAEMCPHVPYVPPHSPDPASNGALQGT